MTRFLFRWDVKQNRKLQWLFQMGLHYAFRHGVVDTAGAGAAVAIWTGPRKASAAAMELLLRGAIEAPLRLGVSATWRVLSLLRGMDRLHAALSGRAHWYLLGLAVHPQYQGKGLGSCLVRYGLRRAHAQALPCYLETTNSANVPFYQHHSFRLTGERRATKRGLALWGMIAEVQPCAPTAQP